jgi:hypothetical protein
MPISAPGKIFHLCGSEIGGRAAAPVKLDHRPLARHAARHVVDFPLERREVGNRDLLIFLNGNVARAEKAQALAEGKMHVERERSA